MADSSGFAGSTQDFGLYRQCGEAETMIHARGWHTSLFCVVVAFGIVGGVSARIAVGQRPEPPRLALDFNGSAGKTRALGFLESGRRFFAAGENKVVQFYDILPDNIVPGNTVRWEFARGSLGGINTVNVSRDETRMVIAGESARGYGGDMATVNVRQLSVDGFLRGDAFIVSSAISSDGSRMVSADVNGQVVLWTSEQDNITRTILQDVPAQANKYETQRTFNRVLLVNDRHVLFFVPQSLRDGSTFYGIVSCEIETGNHTTLGDQFESSGTGLSSSNDGNVIVAGEFEGKVSVRTQGIASAPSSHRIHAMLGDPKNREHRIQNIAVSPDGACFAVMGDYKGQQPVRSFLALFDTKTLTLMDRVEFQGQESCVVAAFDASSSKLLSHDDSSEQLLLWQLKNDNGKPVGKPLSSQNPIVVNGHGRIFRQAQFSSDHSTTEAGYRIDLTDVQNRKISIHLGNGPLQEADGAIEPTNGPDAFAPGWTVQADAPSPPDKLRQNLYLVPAGSGKATFQPIVLNVKEQGAYSGAFTFIKGPDGKPFAAAIGTFKNDGVFLYRIPIENGGRPYLIRYFRDHNGLISDLSVSSDQKYLVSCSPDKCVKIWSLEGITRPQQESVFGATIQLEADGHVHLRDVIKAGILFARGFREGDVLSRAQNATVAEGGVTEAEKIEDLLSTHPAFGDLFLWAERTGIKYQLGGNDDRFRLVPGWEPLLTLVSDKAGEWVLFTPEGYFDASIVDGDRLFGWQINQGADKPPRFEPAEHLQKDFEKPEVIRQLLKIGNVPDALSSLNRIVPDDLRASLQNKINQLPAVKILSPADGTIVENSTPLMVRTKITFSQPADMQRFEVNASQSGRSLGPAREEVRKGTVLELAWESQEIAAANDFSVVAKEKSAEVSNSYLGKANVNVLGLGKKQRSPEARVHFLAFAVDKYQKEQSLSFSVESVGTFRNDLSSFSGSSRAFSSLGKTLIEEEVTRSSVDNTLKNFLAIRKKSGSVDDLIIVAVCGHGVSKSAATSNREDVEDAPEEFFFLPHDVDPNDMKQLADFGIRWKDICDGINDVDCDVLWIVDACHSGRAFDEAKRAFAECRGTGGRHVIFAAQAAGIALERSSYIVRRTDAGNTALFMAIRETLVRKNEVEPDVETAVEPLWKDGFLTFDELSRYSAQRTSQVSRKSQSIVFTPRAPGSELKPLVLGAGASVPQQTE